MRFGFGPDYGHFPQENNCKRSCSHYLSLSEFDILFDKIAQSLICNMIIMKNYHSMKAFLGLVIQPYNFIWGAVVLFFNALFIAAPC